MQPKDDTIAFDLVRHKSVIGMAAAGKNQKTVVQRRDPLYRCCPEFPGGAEQLRLTAITGLPAVIVEVENQRGGANISYRLRALGAQNAGKIVAFGTVRKQQSAAIRRTVKPCRAIIAMDPAGPAARPRGMHGTIDNGYEGDAEKPGNALQPPGRE